MKLLVNVTCDLCHAAKERKIFTLRKKNLVIIILRITPMKSNLQYK